MVGFKAYKYYLAVKLHFSSDSYDLFEHNGRVRASLVKFNERNDKYLFEKVYNKLGGDKEFVEFIVSNYMYGNDDAMYTPEESMANYKVWQKRKQSLTEVFRDDLDLMVLHAQREKLGQPLVETIHGLKGQHPEMFKLYLGGSISIETCSIIERLDPYLHEWKQELGLFWEQARRIGKCHRFVKFDENRMNQLYLNFKSELEAMK